MSSDTEKDLPSSETKANLDFDATVAEFEGPLLRYATRLLNNSKAAEDVVQTAFIKLFKAWHTTTFRDAKISSWIYRVTHNAAIDHIRKESRRRNLHQRHTEEHEVTGKRVGGPTTKEISDAAADAAVLLNQLPVRDREVVILKIYEEKSYREISEITGLTESNVGYILHHSLKTLASGLKNQKED